TMTQAIGLAPGLTLSPAQLVAAFDWLTGAAPEVLAALRATPRAGTLAGLDASPWFASRGYALKSGTVRDLRGGPLHGWIVASGAGVLAAIHAEGLPATRLLSPLRDALQADAAPLAIAAARATANVQVLSLVPKTAVSFACPDGSPLVGGPDAGGGATVRMAT